MYSNSIKNVHFFNLFRLPIGGSEIESAQLASNVAAFLGARTHLWSASSQIHPDWKKRGVRYAGPLTQPRSGRFVCSGIYWSPKAWMSWAKPSSLSVIVNTVDEEAFHSAHKIWRELAPFCRFFFVSAFQRRLLQGDGAILHSPISLEDFPVVGASSRLNRAVTVGRISRDLLSKHNHLVTFDVARYLRDRRCRFVAMGGSAIRGELNASGVDYTLHDEGSMTPTAFFSQIDIFWYQTGGWAEAFGRVVAEAMASGLPVVAHRYGGYAELIEHGVDGFLYDGIAEALAILDRLIGDPDLRELIGRNARKKMENLFSAEALRVQLTTLLESDS